MDLYFPSQLPITKLNEQNWLHFTKTLRFAVLSLFPQPYFSLGVPFNTHTNFTFPMSFRITILNGKQKVLSCFKQQIKRKHIKICNAIFLKIHHKCKILSYSNPSEIPFLGFKRLSISLLEWNSEFCIVSHFPFSSFNFTCFETIKSLLISG